MFDPVMIILPRLCMSSSNNLRRLARWLGIDIKDCDIRDVVIHMIHYDVISKARTDMCGKSEHA